MIYVFCMRSMASGGAFHRTYLHASQQAFPEAHELGFAYFGGVFQRLRYDNLTSAVKKVLRGHQRVETERFIAFRSHWRFQAEFCTPGAGDEKGEVKSENGCFWRNHLVLIPVARDLEYLNQMLLAACGEDERRVISGRTQRVGAAMNEERSHLLPVAEEGFELAGIHYPKVNNSGCVKVLTNFYSPPVAPGTEVHVRVYAACVEIWHEGKRVARHERCFGRQQKVPNLEHYLEAWSRKLGALAGARAMAGQLRPPLGLVAPAAGQAGGDAAMVEVLLLGRENGWDQFRAAVAEAIEWNCWDVAAVRYLLLSAQQSRVTIEPVDIGALSRYERPRPTVRNYD